MKPKDLAKTIKSYSARKPLYDDGVLTIPSNYFDHEKKSLPEFIEKLNSKESIHVEFCSGNGEWIIERAIKNPEILYIAVEKKFMRVRKIWSKMKNRSIENLIICAGMGEDLLAHYIDDNCIDKFFINFPDPWPKKRHAKHRIVKKTFIDAMNQALKDDGDITITTDDDNYSQEIISLFGADASFTNKFPNNGYTILDENYGASYFRRLWNDMGRINKLMNFQKKITL